jgi:hypothetical protein
MGQGKLGKGQAPVFTCGTPRDVCLGFHVDMNARLRGSGVSKVHNSPQDALKCHSRYLISLGYEQLSPREFRTPDGIRVLTKGSRFGAKLINGKANSRHMAPNKFGIIASY